MNLPCKGVTLEVWLKTTGRNARLEDEDTPGFGEEVTLEVWLRITGINAGLEEEDTSGLDKGGTLEVWLKTTGINTGFEEEGTPGFAEVILLVRDVFGLGKGLTLDEEPPRLGKGCLLDEDGHGLGEVLTIEVVWVKTTFMTATNINAKH